MKKLIDNDVLSTSKPGYVDEDYGAIGNQIEVGCGLTMNPELLTVGPIIHANVDDDTMSYGDIFSPLTITVDNEGALNSLISGPTFWFGDKIGENGTYIYASTGQIRIVSSGNDNYLEGIYSPDRNLTYTSTGTYSSTSTALSCSIDFTEHKDLKYCEYLDVTLTIISKDNKTSYVAKGTIENDSSRTNSYGSMRMKYGTTSDDIADVFISAQHPNKDNSILIYLATGNCSFDSTMTKYQITVTGVSPR